MFPRTDRPRGVAVVVVMLMLLLVVSFTTAAGLLTRQNYSDASWRERILEANYAYQAGLSTAMERLTADPAWAPTEAMPYEEFLDDASRVGFRVWLDGVNTNSDIPVISASGHSLLKGQAAIKVVALVNGQEVSSGFGGADSTPVMVRPTMEFDNNLLQPDPANTLFLAPSPATFLSYDSVAGIPPWAGLPAPPPANNQRASLRSLGDISLGLAQVYGEAILPTTAALNPGGGSVNAELRVDDAYLPRRFARPDLSGGLATANASAPIPPGNYKDFLAPNSGTLQLYRGGTYFFETISLGADSTVRLLGPPSDGACVIYTHGFSTGPNVRINMPDPMAPPDPSNPMNLPRPADLQIYGVPQPGCDVSSLVLGDNSQTACVAAGNNLRFNLQMGAKLYGSVIAAEINIAPNVEIHYDESLRGQPTEGLTEWVLVSQGRR